MKKLSFFVAIFCGLAQAAEFKLPSVTYDEKAFKDALTQADRFSNDDELAQKISFQQDWIDLNHVVATARAQQYVAHGKHVKPWLDFWVEFNRLTTANTQCDSNKLEQCIFQAQMDLFNGLSKQQNMDKAKKCATDAKCDCPAFTDGMGSASQKFDAAMRNDDNLRDDASRVVGNRLGAAIRDHSQRWQKIWQNRANAFKSVAKTAGCDVDCVQNCTHRYTQITVQDKDLCKNQTCYVDGKQYHAGDVYMHNRTIYSSPSVEQCATECKCFDSTVKINWGSINYQKIAEKEYGKPIASFTEKESAQLAQSLSAYEESYGPQELI